MNKNLKLFTNHSAYNAVKNNLDKPNVVMCQSEGDVHYNPWVETRLVATFDVEYEDNPTSLYSYLVQGDIEVTGEIMFDKIEIDDVEVSISDLDNTQGMYQLSTGEHIVKYTLKDPTSIGIDGDIENLGELYSVGATFFTCNNLVNITIPNSVTNINNYAFFQCHMLENVNIPNTVVNIGDHVFDNCNLSSIIIPSSVAYIEPWTFYSNDSLIIRVDPSNTTYDSRNNCNAIIETATNKLIVGCQNTIIPNSVTSIEDGAFGNCTGFTTITIPNSVTSIGRGAFEYTSDLISVIIESVIPPTIDSEYLPFGGSNCTIYVPAESVEAYKTAWSTYANRIQAIVQQ